MEESDWNFASFSPIAFGFQFIVHRLNPHLGCPKATATEKFLNIFCVVKMFHEDFSTISALYLLMK